LIELRRVAHRVGHVITLYCDVIAEVDPDHTWMSLFVVNVGHDV